MDPVAMTRKTYDSIAAAYAERCGGRYANLVADAAGFAAAVPAGWVADIGCGPGRDMRVLREYGLRVVGVDLSATMLVAGGVSGVVHADMRGLPLRARCLAGVWCQAAMLHIPHAQVPEVLAEMARTCMARARLHLVVAEGEGEAVEPDAHGSGLPRFFAYHRPERLRGMVSDAGFDVLDTRVTDGNRRWLHLRGVRR